MNKKRKKITSEDIKKVSDSFDSPIQKQNVQKLSINHNDSINIDNKYGLALHFLLQNPSINLLIKHKGGNSLQKSVNNYGFTGVNLNSGLEQLDYALFRSFGKPKSTEGFEMCILIHKNSDAQTAFINWGKALNFMMDFYGDFYATASFLDFTIVLASNEKKVLLIDKKLEPFIDDRFFEYKEGLYEVFE